MPELASSRWLGGLGRKQQEREMLKPVPGRAGALHLSSFPIPPPLVAAGHLSLPSLARSLGAGSGQARCVSEAAAAHPTPPHRRLRSHSCSYFSIGRTHPPYLTTRPQRPPSTRKERVPTHPQRNAQPQRDSPGLPPPPLPPSAAARPQPAPAPPIARVRPPVPPSVPSRSPFQPPRARIAALS